MNSVSHFEQTFPLALRACSVHSRNAAMRGTAAWRDVEDLRQEGLLACWRALPRFDPSRASLPTFLERVVANRASSVLRSSRTPVMLSLDAADACTVDLGLRQIHLQIDVARVLQRLNENDRRLAVTLMMHTPTETSRAFRLSRSTVYEGIRRIRIAFEDAGLGLREGAVR